MIWKPPTSLSKGVRRNPPPSAKQGEYPPPAGYSGLMIGNSTGGSLHHKVYNVLGIRIKSFFITHFFRNPFPMFERFTYHLYFCDQRIHRIFYHILRIKHFEKPVLINFEFFKICVGIILRYFEKVTFTMRQRYFIKSLVDIFLIGI